MGLRPIVVRCRHLLALVATLVLFTTG